MHNLSILWITSLFFAKRVLLRRCPVLFMAMFAGQTWCSNGPFSLRWVRVCSLSSVSHWRHPCLSSVKYIGLNIEILPLWVVVSDMMPDCHLDQPMFICWCNHWWYLVEPCSDIQIIHNVRGIMSQELFSVTGMQHLEIHFVTFLNFAHNM